MAELPYGVTSEHIRESNLIESIDDPHADALAEQAWTELAEWSLLTLDLVLECHWAITQEQLGEDAGVLRHVDVMVGGRVCPPWQQVPELLNQWLGTMTRWRELDPQQMHVGFEHIHPFVDGNGRTGRHLLWWHQARLGQAPTLLRASQRHRYYEWFRLPTELDAFDRRWLLGPTEDGRWLT